MNDLPITLNIDYDNNNIKKQGTCVIFELIFRKLDDERFNGKRWLFDTVTRNKNVDTFFGKSRQ